MPEIMGRMRDQAQLRLQNLERDYCSTLNALAACCLLPDKGQGPQEGGGMSLILAAAAARRERAAEEGGRRPAEPVAVGSGGSSSLSPVAVPPSSSSADAPLVGRASLLKALSLLEASHRVGEYGIDAEAAWGGGGSTLRELEAAAESSHSQQHEDISAKDASIRAWRFVQVG